MAYGFSIGTTAGLIDITNSTDIGLRIVGDTTVFITELALNVQNTGVIQGPSGFDISKGDILCWQNLMNPSCDIASYLEVNLFNYAPKLSWDVTAHQLTWDATRVAINSGTSDRTLTGEYVFMFVHRE